MQESSGILLFRKNRGRWEVLLVHPSGAYNRRAPWSIPKGVPEPGESRIATARRETLEETGMVADGLIELGHADYMRSRKRVYAFAAPASLDARPRCASWEVDRAEFLPLAEALRKIHPDQRVFIERLRAILPIARAKGSHDEKSAG